MFGGTPNVAKERVKNNLSIFSHAVSVCYHAVKQYQQTLTAWLRVSEIIMLFYFHSLWTAIPIKDFFAVCACRVIDFFDIALFVVLAGKVNYISSISSIDNPVTLLIIA